MLDSHLLNLKGHTGNSSGSTLPADIIISNVFHIFDFYENLQYSTDFRPFCPCFGFPGV